MPYLPIKQWPDSERPREKLCSMGAASLSSAELIAILLGSGTGNVSAIDLGKELLKRFATLENLSGASVTELQKLKGIGCAKAVTLKAAFQLARNMQ